MAITATGISPRLIRRECGGWLAVSPPESPLKLGAVGETEAAARAAFEAEVSHWDRLADLVDQRSNASSDVA
jgi:hypothetical protein